MKDQPWHLNQTWPVGRKWCRFTNTTQTFRGGPSPNLGRKKHQILDQFFATSVLDTAYFRNETSHRHPKCCCQSTMCPLQLNLLSVTFDPEMAEG